MDGERQTSADTPGDRLLIAGPNLTIDRTLSTRELRPGHDPDITDAVVSAGGKGVNVARAAQELGLDATLIGLLPGHMGEAVARLLADEGIRLVGVPVSGELRTAVIIHERGGRATVLNEPGPELTPREWLGYENEVARALDGHGIVVCGGSLPPGAPPEAYARIVELAHARERRAVVDASGAALLHALDQRPDVVCPNLGEAEAALFGTAGELVDAPADARERAEAAARALVAAGARTAIVTAAGAGAGLADAERSGTSWLTAPRVDVANPMGAGDAFAAGLAAGMARGLGTEDAARLAVAVGSASVEHPRAGRLEAPRAELLLSRIRAEH
jgi:1-phosphofructokinase family hexose kinase